MRNKVINWSLMLQVLIILYFYWDVPLDLEWLLVSIISLVLFNIGLAKHIHKC